jgi:hypothetical protein
MPGLSEALSKYLAAVTVELRAAAEQQLHAEDEARRRATKEREESARRVFKAIREYPEGRTDAAERSSGSYIRAGACAACSSLTDGGVRHHACEACASLAAFG